ncbi:MAG TPA: ABC transporter permease subunit [Candidatus Norongarragalinales archaeon]|nr:ABC transporter permease subunit [Candidatus Norongarragalinales archaeon]
MVELSRGWKIIAFALAALFLAFALGRLGLKTSADLFALPLLAFYSFYRMFFAYILSLVFSLFYGYYAATNKRAAKVMLLILDILQSIPILGFFPAAVFLIINAFQGNVLGLELASIFLIFTSMVWNMTFDVYESLLTIPKDILAASKAFGLKRFLLFKNLILPATIPKLVYNSMISWAGGWYFLIASEIISLGSTTHKLPGIGSYLLETTARGDIPASLLGLGALMLIIITMDLLIWRPLTVWSDKFKYESTKGKAGMKSAVYKFYKWSPAMVRARKMLSRTYDHLLDDLELIVGWLEKKNAQNKIYRQAFTVIRYGILIAVLAVILNSAWLLLKLALSIVMEPIPPEAIEIPRALLYSFGRMVVAFLIALAWTIPTAIYVMRHPERRKYLVPIFEIAAAVPSPALFPIIILFTLWLTSSLGFAAILLIMTGMQWYLLFNAMAGVRNLPTDLDEAATAFGVRGNLYYKKVFVPAMLPSLITGCITAFGGGWNALVIAEYVRFSGCAGGVCMVEGIGSFLSKTTYSTMLAPAVQAKLIFLALFSMVAAIFLLNHFFWRRIYNHALKKYRLE